MGPDDVRRLALALPQTSEEPHHDRTSFRVGGKIFATMPADAATLNVMLGEAEARAGADEAAGAVELLWWGRRLSGVQVCLALAEPPLVADLLEEAWRRRAPQHIVAAYEAGDHGADAVREQRP